MSCCRCSSAAPPRTSTTSNSASAAAGARTSGPIPAPRRSAPTPVAAFRTTRPSSRPPCSRTRSLDLTDRGDIVVDPFLGSGSTLIAADKTGRVCRGVELDPLYVDVILRRYQAATGSPPSSLRPARRSTRWQRGGERRRRPEWRSSLGLSERVKSALTGRCRISGGAGILDYCIRHSRASDWLRAVFGRLNRFQFAVAARRLRGHLCINAIVNQFQMENKHAPSGPAYLDPRSGRTYSLSEPRWRSEEGRPLMITPLPGIGRGDIHSGTRSLWRYAASLPIPVTNPVSPRERRRFPPYQNRTTL